MMTKTHLNYKSIIVLTLLALFILIFPFSGVSNYQLQFLINAFMYAYFASVWNYIGGYAGQMAMGNGVYIGIGAYVSTVLYCTYGLSPWLGMLVGGLISGLLSLVIGSITFRLSGTYYSLATVAFLHMTRMLVMSNNTLFGFETRGAKGIYIPFNGFSFFDFMFESKVWYYFIILVMLGIALGVSYYIKTSQTGYYLMAINTNQEAASSLGVDTMRMKLKAGFIAAFFTAMGGTFFVQMYAVVDPSRVLGYDLSAQIMVYAIIGGKGTLWGPVVAAAILSPISDYLRSAFGANIPGLNLIIYGLALMLIVYYLPKGIWPPISEFLNKIFGNAPTVRGKKAVAIQSEDADDNAKEV